MTKHPEEGAEPILVEARAATESGKTEHPEKAAESIFEKVRAATELGRLLIVVAVVAFLMVHWSTFQHLLDGITDIKTTWGDLHIDHESFKQQYASIVVPTKSEFVTGNPAVAWNAFWFAAHVAPSISGARILWVDPNPSNNRDERRLLRKLDIVIDVATNTADAIERTQEQDYDLVISNIGGENPPDLSVQPPATFQQCPAAFYDGLATAEDIRRLPGVIRAELLAEHDPSFAAQRRLIFYSGDHGPRVADRCARVSTNRTDILFQTVISALAELRADQLPPPATDK